ncbi:uncharacterized protein LOC116340309 [Contarinia nasturtii]|uniref:uncharacterized protein LOC116340309 n=1 Tax=Contarinia nasturtii TaxID=265458 RepID=UPI0012D3E327|nr:uncharacterized protein LOC116340309 [Contarinia nasturtii]
MKSVLFFGYILAMMNLLNKSITTHKCCGHNIIETINLNLSLGEAPHWDKRCQSWYFTDFYAESVTLYRLEYATLKLYSAKIPGVHNVSYMLPTEDDEHLFHVGHDLEMILVKWDGFSPIAKKIDVLFRVQQSPKYAMNRLHVGKADPRGRLFTVTYNTKLCGDVALSSVYRDSCFNGLTSIFTHQRSPAGLTWNPKTNRFYYFDLCYPDIYECKWNSRTGDIRDCRVIFVLEMDNPITYVLSGLTIDRNGYIYFCIFNKSVVLKVDPRNGEIVEEFKFEVPTVISLSFGGSNLDTMLVTTSNTRINLENGTIIQSDLPKNAGSLFLIKCMKARGYPGQNVRLCPKARKKLKL